MVEYIKNVNIINEVDIPRKQEELDLVNEAIVELNKNRVFVITPIAPREMY